MNYYYAVYIRQCKACLTLSWIAVSSIVSSTDILLREDLGCSWFLTFSVSTSVNIQLAPPDGDFSISPLIRFVTTSPFPSVC